MTISKWYLVGGRASRMSREHGTIGGPCGEAPDGTAPVLFWPLACCLSCCSSAPVENTEIHLGKDFHRHTIKLSDVGACPPAPSSCTLAGFALATDSAASMRAPCLDLGPLGLCLHQCCSKASVLPFTPCLPSLWGKEQRTVGLQHPQCSLLSLLPLNVASAKQLESWVGWAGLCACRAPALVPGVFHLGSISFAPCRLLMASDGDQIKFSSLPTPALPN